MCVWALPYFLALQDTPEFISCPSLRIRHLCKGLWFLLLENGIGNQKLGSRSPHCYWDIIVLHPEGLSLTNIFLRRQSCGMVEEAVNLKLLFGALGYTCSCYCMFECKQSISLVSLSFLCDVQRGYIGILSTSFTEFQQRSREFILFENVSWIGSFYTKVFKIFIVILLHKSCLLSWF